MSFYEKPVPGENQPHIDLERNPAEFKEPSHAEEALRGKHPNHPEEAKDDNKPVPIIYGMPLRSFIGGVMGYSIG